MTRYSHLLSLGFTVESDHPAGEDITIEMIVRAVKDRLLAIAINDEWQEAVLPPLESFES